ncbi:MAG: glycine betaine ABC transporter substrate-binding protein, partial [Atribacterota bacterium]
PVINIMKVILEDKLNYEVEFVPTLYGELTFLALVKDPLEVDIFAECWQLNFQSLIDKYVINEKKAEIVSTSYLAPQGFVVPTYLIKGDPARGIAPLAPDLYSVEQLNDYIHLFDRNKDGSGDLIGGPDGWVCSKINEWQLESWGLNFHQLTQEEWVSSSLLIAAYQEGEPILSFFYEPTWQSSQLDLTWLEAPEYSDEAWSDYKVWEDWKAGKEVSWKPGKACAYPESKVLVVVTNEFKKKYPKAYQFLQNWSIPLEDLKELCYKIEIERLPVNYVASTYIKEHPEMVNRWLKGIK